MYQGQHAFLSQAEGLREPSVAPRVFPQPAYRSGPSARDRQLIRSMRDIPFFLQDFVDRYEGRYRDVQLQLPIRLV
jgi:hypothetical protein